MKKGQKNKKTDTKISKLKNKTTNPNQNSGNENKPMISTKRNLTKKKAWNTQKHHKEEIKLQECNKTSYFD